MFIKELPLVEGRYVAKYDLDKSGGFSPEEFGSIPPENAADVDNILCDALVKGGFSIEDVGNFVNEAGYKGRSLVFNSVAPSPSCEKQRNQLSFWLVKHPTARATVEYADKLFNNKQSYLRDAKEVYEEALQQNPSSELRSYIYKQLGNIHSIMSMPVEELFSYNAAIACYKKALEINPNYIPAKVNLFIMAYRMGDYAGANDLLKRIPINLLSQREAEIVKSTQKDLDLVQSGRVHNEFLVEEALLLFNMSRVKITIVDSADKERSFQALITNIMSQKDFNEFVKRANIDSKKIIPNPDDENEKQIASKLGNGKLLPKELMQLIDMYNCFTDRLIQYPEADVAKFLIDNWKALDFAYDSLDTTGCSLVGFNAYYLRIPQEYFVRLDSSDRRKWLDTIEKSLNNGGYRCNSKQLTTTRENLTGPTLYNLVQSLKKAHT